MNKIFEEHSDVLGLKLRLIGAKDRKERLEILEQLALYYENASTIDDAIVEAYRTWKQYKEEARSEWEKQYAQDCMDSCCGRMSFWQILKA